VNSVFFILNILERADPRSILPREADTLIGLGPFFHGGDIKESSDRRDNVDLENSSDIRKYLLPTFRWSFFESTGVFLPEVVRVAG
jgi:hypothetical protein